MRYFIGCLLLIGCSSTQVTFQPEPIRIDTVYVQNTIDEASYLAVIDALNSQLDSLSASGISETTKVYVPVYVGGKPLRPKRVFPLDTTVAEGSVSLKFNLTSKPFYSDINIKPAKDSIEITPQEAIKRATEPYLPEWAVAILGFLAGLLPLIYKLRKDAKTSS